MNADAISVIFVEDDDVLREATLQALELEGFAVAAHDRARPALQTLTTEFPGVVVSDIRMPGMDGMEFFSSVQAIDPTLPVIFTTGHGDVAMAVGAMKRGAADFLTKPYSPAALIAAIRRSAEKRLLAIENQKLRQALRERENVGLIGSSDKSQRLEMLLREVARTDIDIVLKGPVGTGKTFLSRRIHDLGVRHNRPFVSIDAGVWTHPDVELMVFGRAPSEHLSRSGLVERAQGGTLVLDSLELAPEALRGRLSSLIETRTYVALGAERATKADLRIIATTGHQPDRHSLALLRSLGGITIELPSLADRRDDIPEIFRHFVARFEHELATAADPLGASDWARLMGYEWPGNLRELRDFARNFVLGLTRLEQAQGQDAGHDRSLHALVMTFEHSILVDALSRCGGRTTEVEKLLKLKRKTLYDKLSRHGLKPAAFRAK